MLKNYPGMIEIARFAIGFCLNCFGCALFFSMRGVGCSPISPFLYAYEMRFSTRARSLKSGTGERVCAPHPYLFTSIPGSLFFFSSRPHSPFSLLLVGERESLGSRVTLSSLLSWYRRFPYWLQGYSYESVPNPFSLRSRNSIIMIQPQELLTRDRPRQSIKGIVSICIIIKESELEKA